MSGPKRPNVLVFIPHDLGDHLHCYGHETVRSPNLDTLAERGVRFANCFTTSPECTPSRGGLWTGLQPHQNGLMGLSNFGWELRATHLARRLQDSGYRTHLFGFQHERHGSPELLGYEQHHTARDIKAVSVCEELEGFLRSDDTGPDASPWFACAGFKDVHRPWENPSTFDSAEIDVPGYLPDIPVVREDLALLHQNIREMDAAVGRVLDRLASSEVGRNTIVVFTTDHGIGFPRAKATLYDPGIRVSLLMHWPGVIEGGSIHDGLVSNLDVTPTLLELCGCDVPEGLEGRSFRSLLRGESYEERDAVYGGLFYDVAYDPMHYVRTRTHKYTRSFAVTEEERAGADQEVLATHEAGQWIRVDDYDVMSSAAWQGMDVDRSPPPREELYDLRADPWEQRNLVEIESAATVLHEMRERLSGWMERTASPLLNGHVDPPEKQREANRKYRPGGEMYG